MSEIAKYFDNTISRDLLELCNGRLISQGSTRTVFRSAMNPNMVLKYETSARRFQNIMEWETWEIVKHTHYKRWFAPCHNISDCGTILLQEYCRDSEDNELVAELPAFFTDIKKENFGIYNGLLVCRDYGNTLLIDQGINKRMKKVEW